MTPFLPMTREEAGGEPLDIILVTGDAYVDHPAWGVAAIGRWLQAHGFTVGVIAQPDGSLDGRMQAQATAQASVQLRMRIGIG